MKKKILIVDDDVFISEQLKDILTDLGYIVTDIAYNRDTAIHSLKNNPPDLAILDIKMHGENQGFEIAKFINDNLDVPFIFLTSFSDTSTVKEASDLRPEAYLVKPFNQHNIFSTLEVVLNKFTNKKKAVIIKNGGFTFKIAHENILWIKSDDKYIEIFTSDRKYIERTSLSTFLENNSLTNTVRVHRSYAVNFNKVESLKNNFIVINGQEIPISRKYYSDVKKRMNG